jgi:hypothetical protein
MKGKPLILGFISLTLMAAATGVLVQFKSTHKLGEPGVKTRPLPGTGTLEVLLPENVPGYKSVILPEAQIVLDKLPKDSSFGQRSYTSDDGKFQAQVNVVLMGTDRSSIHKPQICLTGQGWACDNQATRPELVRLEKPFPYDLEVNKYVASKVVEMDGRPQTVRGLYVYWYVDGTHHTAKQWEWMAWWMPQDLVLHGLLERWAYISIFTVCAPGGEDQAFGQVKKLMAGLVPQFQVVPRAGETTNSK